LTVYYGGRYKIFHSVYGLRESRASIISKLIKKRFCFPFLHSVENHQVRVGDRALINEKVVVLAITVSRLGTAGGNSLFTFQENH